MTGDLWAFVIRCLYRWHWHRTDDADYITLRPEHVCAVDDWRRLTQ